MEKTILVFDDQRQITFDGEVNFDETVGFKIAKGITEVVDGIKVKTYYVCNENKGQIYEKENDLFYK